MLSSHPIPPEENKILELQFPLKIKSEANNYDHWTIKKKRKDNQKLLVKHHLRTQLINLKLPLMIVMTRISPRSLDEDNLVSALKTIKDAIADHIRPNQAPGQADNTNLIQWAYNQEKGPPKTNALKLEMYSIPNSLL